MQIAGATDGSGQASEWVRQLAYWNAFFESGYTNPIDEALKQLKPDCPVPPVKTGEIPYDFIRKRLTIAIRTETGNQLISKGAFAQILLTCTRIRLPDGRIEDISAHIQELTNRFDQYGTEGYRVIAVCYKDIETDLITKDLESEMTFAGFILMNDPVKAGITETIQELQNLHVGLKTRAGGPYNHDRQGTAPY